MDLRALPTLPYPSFPLRIQACGTPGLQIDDRAGSVSDGTVVARVPSLTLPAKLAPEVPNPKSTIRTIPRLSVIVVNYRRWEDTARLVRQLRAAPALRQGAAEVVVVDNHSPAHPIIPRLRRWSGVSLRRWRRNRGFARAVNEGCRLAQGEWLLLLNPDMTLDPVFLDKVLIRGEELAQQHEDLGIVGFGLRNSDGSLQLSTGPFPTLVSTLLRLVLPRHRRKYQTTSTEQVESVDWVTGCCLLIRRQCWEQLGGLDPAFFLYYEDVDLCQRARALGWSIVHEPGLIAVHHHPLHSRSVPPALRTITRHALLTYAFKHWPAWQARILARIVCAEARCRRLWTRLRGDQTASSTFAQLERIGKLFRRGMPEQANRCLARLIQQGETGETQS